MGPSIVFIVIGVCMFVGYSIFNGAPLAEKRRRQGRNSVIAGVVILVGHLLFIHLG